MHSRAKLTLDSRPMFSIVVHTMQTQGIRFLFVHMLAVAFYVCPPSAPAQEAGRLRDTYQARGEDFFQALFWLPESSNFIRSRIPGIDTWEGFEPGLWAKVSAAAKLDMLEALGKEWDAAKEPEREKHWQRLDAWSAISADLTLLAASFEGIEEFHQVCFEDPLLQPAYAWLLARRPKDFGPEHVGSTMASSELDEAWVKLTLHLLEKSPKDRHECFARVAAKLTPAPSDEAADDNKDDAELQRLLAPLSKLRMGDKHAAVKKLLPQISALKADAGDDNTEALITTQLGKVTLQGEFNFAKGGLVSHGFRTSPLPLDHAQALLERCVRIMEELHGESERRIDLPGDSDGPANEIGLSFNWHIKGRLIGIDYSLQKNQAVVSWGAQGE